MRRLVTSVLAGGLGVLAVVAAVDAFRGAGGLAEHVEAPAEPAAGARFLQARLRAAGAAGLLTYSDDRCRLHAVRLPSLAPADAPGVTMCEPLVPSGGMTAWNGDVVWSGLGFGTVTTVLDQKRIEAAVRRHPRARSLAWEGRGRYAARQVVSLGAGRLAVVVEHRRAPWERLLAVFEDRRLRFLVPGWVGEDDVLRPSPRGRYIALLRPGEPGVRVVTASGESLELPDITNPRAIAWSPDERWTALATRWSIYVFPTGASEGTIRIPLAARDLDWGD